MCDATKDVIKGLLVLEPHRRLTCSQVLARLTPIIAGPVPDHPQVITIIPVLSTLFYFYKHLFCIHFEKSILFFVKLELECSEFGILVNCRLSMEFLTIFY